MYVWIVAFVVLLANIASVSTICSEEFDVEKAKIGTEDSGVYTGDNDQVKVVFKFDYLKSFIFDTLTVVPLENVDALTVTGRRHNGDRIAAKFTDPVPNLVTEHTVIQKTGEFQTTVLNKLIVNATSTNGGTPKIRIDDSTACITV